MDEYEDPLSLSDLSSLVECRVQYRISDYLLPLLLFFPFRPFPPSLASPSTTGRSSSPHPTLEIVPCIDFRGSGLTD
jgi:hypothetical protein